MSNFTCNYCGTIFLSKSTLNTHQRTAKYCIIERGQTPQLYNREDDITNTNKLTEKFICKFCDKILTSKHRLNTHFVTCDAKISYEISELKQQNLTLKDQLDTKDKELITKDKEIVELKAQLYIYKELANRKDDVIDEIAKQPRNHIESQTNNQISIFTNMKPLDMTTDNFCKSIEESFNKDYFIDGQKGAAKFAVEKLLKDEEGKLMYICTDPSRHIYRYKSADGILERDVKAKKLTSVIAENLAKKSHTLGMSEIEKDTEKFAEYSSKYLDIKDMENDNGDFRSALATLVSV